MPVRKYKTLQNHHWQANGLDVSVIREEDIMLIREWRNDQMNILRQSKFLSEEDQRNYFDKIIFPSMREDEPEQILFSILKNEKCIGYGGLVHIDWKKKEGEISFLLKTKRMENKDRFKTDLKIFLEWMIRFAKSELRFNKVTTEVYDVRPDYIEVAKSVGFILEETRPASFNIDGRMADVFKYSYLL